MERKVRDSCGKSVAKGDPAGDAEEAPGPPAESELPVVEINVSFYKRFS
ncbi:hypothetical protein ACIP97_20200 [Peribacillus frigoritolerans]